METINQRSGARTNPSEIDPDAGDRALRLRCVEIASGLSPHPLTSRVIDDAEQMFTWIKTGQRKEQK